MSVDWNLIIEKYYSDNIRLKELLIKHSRSVADKALAIAAFHPEMNVDIRFVEEAAMLHDVGIFLTDAKPIFCYGREKYICHGYLGAELLREEGLPNHALVCERHTGTGIDLEQILERNLPLPHRDMRPVSIEEQLICFADKFFSKMSLNSEKTVEEAEKSLMKFGEKGIIQFRKWCDIFL